MLIKGKRFDFEQDCLPPVESTDVLLYLVLDTSFYTHQQLEAFKSLEAYTIVYNQMLPGWIASVKSYFISNKFIIPGKARVIDALIPVWIITVKQGSIISAHCVDSKASLGETFFHTASALLFVRVEENSPKSKNWRALRSFARGS